MSTEREHRAAHVAGHAFVAQSFGFEVELLTIEGFQESDREQHPEGRYLDEGTMLLIPECPYSVGMYEHTEIHHNLCKTALCGPIAELVHREAEITLNSVQEFSHDWRQAWTAAGYVWPDESARLAFLEQQIGLGQIFLSHACSYEITQPVQQHLIERGRMSAEEFNAVWELRECRKNQ